MRWGQRTLQSAANSSTDELSVSGRLEVADYVTLRAQGCVRLDNTRPDSEECLGLWGKYTDYRVNGPSCALHGAMRDILRCNRSILRHVSRGANRTRLNAANANSERENE